MNTRRHGFCYTYLCAQFSDRRQVVEIKVPAPAPEPAVEVKTEEPQPAPAKKACCVVC